MTSGSKKINKKSGLHFGEHLTIDGYGGDELKLNNSNLVKFALNDLVNKIEMNKLCEPQVFFAEGNGKKDSGGWSGYVVIQESHISIHTFPKRGFVSIDVYTCKEGLQKDLIVKYFIDLFTLKDIETNFIIRGTRYPVQDIY